MPHIYPALLSRVAEAFKQFVLLSELVKDGITYKDSFDGRTAVGIIAEIIKTPDRNLALLLGRALDAQKFFHDVTYDHRLRDNPGEVYQFKERLTAPFMPENNVTDSPMSEHGLGRAPSISSATRIRQPTLTYASDSGSIQTSESQTSFFSNNPTPATSSTNLTHPSTSPQLMTMMSSANSVPLAMDEDSEDDLPVGVFTLLTDCYSPTCSRERLCYSINCPRRLEQMKRLNMKPQPGLSRKLSDESMHDVKVSVTSLSIAYVRKPGHCGSTQCHQRSSTASMTPRRSAKKRSMRSCIPNGTSCGIWSTCAILGSSRSSRKTSLQRTGEKILFDRSSGTYTMFWLSTFR